MAGVTQSLRFRLTALFAIVTTVCIAALGLYLEYALSSQLYAREREHLVGKLELFRHVLSETASTREIESSRHRLADILVGHEELRGSVLHRAGGLIMPLSHFPWPPAMIENPGEDVREVVTEPGQVFRVIVAPATLGGGAETVLVALAQSSALSRQIIGRFRATVVVACVLGSIAAGTLGYFAAARGLRPVQKMAQAAAAVSADRMGERLDIDDTPLELRDLAESFNAMLGRLELSFRQLSEFSADLAHELRTPLTSLMLHAQVALDKPRDETELRHVLASGLEELERLSRMVNDMLFLAQADHSRMPLRREVFDFSEEARKVLEYFQPVADDRNVRFVLEGEARASADRGMVRRAIANLVSNAVRHADPGSTLRVRLSSEGAAAVVAVENRGTPVPAEEASRLFDRFYRATASRDAGNDGTGLGLAIVKSIVELHDGKATVLSRDGETVFKVSFAKAAAGTG